MSAPARSEQRVTVYTDGGCAPTNPGPGGWAAILIKGEHRKELKGGEPLSTNNRMELMGASRGCRYERSWSPIAPISWRTRRPDA